MNGTCIVSWGASLAFAYCSFCSDNISSDSSCDNRGCIVLDGNEIVVGNDDTCLCNVNIYLKDGVNFKKLYIILVKDPSLADESCLQKYVKIDGGDSIWFFKKDVTFSNVSYNGFSKYCRRRLNFSYEAPNGMGYFDFFVLMCLEDDNGRQAVVDNHFKARIMRQNCKNMTSSSNVVNNKVVIGETNKKSISIEDNNIQQPNVDTLGTEVKSNDSNLCMDRIETNVTTNENNYVTNNDVKIDDPNSHMNVIENNIATNEDIVDSDKENSNNDCGINNSILTNENETERNINNGEEVMKGFDINGQEKLDKSIINFESDEKDGVDALMDNKCIGSNLVDDKIDDNKSLNDFVGRNLSKKELIDEDRDVMFPSINKSRVDMVPTNDEKNSIDVSKVGLSKLYGLENVKVVSDKGSDNVRAASTTGLNHKKHGSVDKEKGKDTVINNTADKSGKGCCRGCRAR